MDSCSRIASEKGDGFLSVLQEQVVQKISGLSEENLQFLLEMIERFMQPEATEKKIW